MINEKLTRKQIVKIINDGNHVPVSEHNKKIMKKLGWVIKYVHVNTTGMDYDTPFYTSYLGCHWERVS